MKELAVAVNNQNEYVSPKETIDAIYKAGFRNVFVQWYDREDLSMSQAEQVKYIKQLGMNIIFAHLGYQDMGKFWNNEHILPYIVDRYLKDIDAVKNMGIDMVCMHVVGDNDDEVTEAGLNAFRTIAEHAKEIGVTVTLENTRYREVLHKVFDYTKDLGVGICVDVGHIHCKFNDIFDYDHFNNYIYAVHIHDNHGPKRDEHLLPFDGTIDYKDVLNKLKAHGYNSYLTMELIYQNDYTDMNVEDFYIEGYKRGLKLKEIANSL